MEDFILQLIAQLDTSKAIQDYKTFKENLEKEINIKINLDTSNINNVTKFAEQLQSALSKASNGKLNIDTTQITTALMQVSKNAQQTRQKIDNAFNQGFSKSNNAIKSFANSLMNAGKSSTEIDNIIKKVKDLNVQIDSLKFSESTNGIMNIDVSGLDNFGNKLKITQSLLQDLQTTEWKVSNTTTAVVSTKEIEKLNNAFADYTQKFAQFKSTNANILSGLVQPISDFESKLSGLKNGTISIDDVANSFKSLNTEASKITENFSRQLSPIDSAIRKLASGEETIAGLRAEIKGLDNVPKELSSELNKCVRLLKNVKKIESEQGRSAEWSKAYRQWSDVIDVIQSKLKTLKKEQSNFASTQILNTDDLDKQEKLYVLKVRNTITKIKSELESKLRNAGYTDIEIKGIEETTGKVKSLTATVTDATGAFKQLNFERTKVQKGGKAQDGFVQSDNVKVIGNISSSIDKVQNNLSSLKAKWEEQGFLVGDFKTKVDQLESSISAVGSKGELNGLKTQIESLKNEASTIAQVNKIQLLIDTGGYESKVKSLIAQTQQWTDGNKNARISTDSLSKALENLNAASSALSTNNTVDNQKALIVAEKELDVQIKAVTNSVRNRNAEFAKDSTIASLHQRIKEFYDKNGASHRQWGTQLKQMLAETASGAELTNQRVREIETSFVNVGNAARQAGKLGKTWFQTLKEGMSSFSYWTSSTFLVMKAIQFVKGGIGTVKALDTALVDLEKTTTMTSSELEDFYYSSNKVAKQMGVTTEEIINQASAWSRLGFSSAEAATKMAQLSSQFSSISPGMDVDEATTSLVSMMRAYDVEVDDVLDGIMSKINDVGNKFGTSNAEIAEGLRKSSAAMAAVGGSIESNIALFTGAQEIVQDASQVGNAIRSIALRVRSYDEETEEFSEDLANIKGEVIDLTKVASNDFKGISLFTDASQTEYRDMVEYLGDIADIWDELEAKSQNELLNKLFGKNRAQVGAAMIKNFDQIRSALEVMENSAGSADREMSVIMDSLDYKLNRLKETWGTGVFQNLFKRGDMKTVVDGFTKLGEAVDSLTSKLGLFGSIGLGAGLFAGWKNVGELKFREFYLLIVY